MNHSSLTIKGFETILLRLSFVLGSTSVFSSLNCLRTTYLLTYKLVDVKTLLTSQRKMCFCTGKVFQCKDKYSLFREGWESESKEGEVKRERTKEGRTEGWTDGKKRSFITHGRDLDHNIRHNTYSVYFLRKTGIL